MLTLGLLPKATLVTLVAGATALGQVATIRMELDASVLVPGDQFTVRAYVDNLPVKLRGYQLGLAISGGTSGEIAAAPIEDAIGVETDRADWVFAEIADPDEEVIIAGDARFPPRMVALIKDSAIGFLPSSERYMATFVLKVSDDAAGKFSVSITPIDWPEPPGHNTVLVTTGPGGESFPADVDDPSVIPVGAVPAFFVVESGIEPVVAAVPTTSEWGVLMVAIVMLAIGTIRLRGEERSVAPL